MKAPLFSVNGEAKSHAHCSKSIDWAKEKIRHLWLVIAKRENLDRAQKIYREELEPTDVDHQVRHTWCFD